MLLAHLARWTITLDESYEIPVGHSKLLSYPLIPQPAADFSSKVYSEQSKSSANWTIFIFPNVFEQSLLVTDGWVTDFTHNVLFWDTSFIGMLIFGGGFPRTTFKRDRNKPLFCIDGRMYRKAVWWCSTAFQSHWLFDFATVFHAGSFRHQSHIFLDIVVITHVGYSYSDHVIYI